jgi:hypothetical protein
MPGPETSENDLPLEGKTLFVGPQDIACFASRMAEGLAEGGARVMLYRQVVEPFHPKMDYHRNVDVLFDQAIKRASAKLGKGWLLNLWGSLCLMFYKLLAFLKALIWADACLFIGGRGFIGYPLDYLVLRLFGKKVIHFYVGTASRPRYLSGFARDVLKAEEPPVKQTRKLVRRVLRQSKRVKAVARFASMVVENPLCGHFHPKPFINYFQLGVPVGRYFGEPDSDGPTNQHDEATRVFHCPSAPEVKGTHAIVATMERLKGDGHSIDFVNRSGIPHPEVLDEIRGSHFVIDQLYSDAPLAGFATEAVALGKTPIVGGYGWEILRQGLPLKLFPSSAVCHPDALGDKILELAKDPAKSEVMAKEARGFLNTEWSGIAFSHRISQLLTGKIPDDWWIQPSDVCYLHGMGLSESEVRRILCWVIDLEGEDALCLNHLPNLKQNMIRFARGANVDYARANVVLDARK